MRLRHFFLIAALVMSSGAALSQETNTPGIQVREDPATGWRMATSIELAESENDGARYSNAPRNKLVTWIEAHKKNAEPTLVFLAGQRLQWRLPDEVDETGKYGPWDPTYPAYVGWPFQEADLRYLGGELSCPSRSHWCSRVDLFEVLLPPDLVKSLITDKARKKIRADITGRKITQWQIPKAELIATLDALGVLEEFQ